jgi:hypothetical protein
MVFENPPIIYTHPVFYKYKHIRIPKYTTRYGRRPDVDRLKMSKNVAAYKIKLVVFDVR